jgi:phospho-N-acetylmuramoyl-pentapeptide-transferase
MLYNLLLPYIGISDFANLFHYISFRCGVAFFISLIFSILVGEKFINKLKFYQKGGQPIRTNGPETHLLTKAGTPTMGGILIIFSSLVSIFFTSDISNEYVLILILSLLGFGALGFFDDYLKVTKKTHEGLMARGKILFQLLFGILIGFYIKHLFLKTGVENPLNLSFPFFKNLFIDLSYFYVPFVALVIISSSNAVNLTDGLDGLAIFPIILSLLCFGIISYLAGNSIYSSYLYMTYIPGASEIAVVSAAIIGSGLGFLWFNAKPAQIFMGDVGSLSLGALIGVMSVIAKHEVTLVIIGGLFVAESLSVIIQVLYFKATKGKRFFKMAPIHHHYEKLGLPETKVVIRFWIVSIIFAVIGLLSIKIR